MRYEAGTKEKEEEKTPQVQEWLDETEKTLHILNENIIALITGLAGVLRGKFPWDYIMIQSDGTDWILEEQKVGPKLVPVAFRIRNLKLQANQCVYLINSIMDRLEV